MACRQLKQNLGPNTEPRCLDTKQPAATVRIRYGMLTTKEFVHNDVTGQRFDIKQMYFRMHARFWIEFYLQGHHIAANF